MEISKGNINKDIIDSSLKVIHSIKDSMTSKDWNCDLRTSSNLTFNILNVQALWPLKFKILEIIHSHMLNNNKFFDGMLSSSWVNIYEKGFYQEFHNHRDDVARCLSGVAYFTPLASPIVFGIEEPLEIKPEAGDVLVFEDDLLHRVLPNKSDDLRISLAFNYKKLMKWEGLSQIKNQL